MKKIIFFLSPFLLVFCFSFSVHAEFMPPTLPDLNSVNLPLFLEQVGQMTMVNNGNGTFIPETDLNTLNQIVNGRTIEQSIQNHYVDNALLSNDLQLFYDSNGNLIPQSNTYTVVGTSDIVNFSYVCDKQTGQILFSYDEYDNMMSTLIAGDQRYFASPFGTVDRQEQLQNEINSVLDSGMIVFGDHVSDLDREFLKSYDFYMYYESNYFGYSVFVPNCCTVDTIADVWDGPWEYKGSIEHGGYGSGFRPIIRTNNPSDVIYSTEGNYNYLNQESNQQYGYRFNYISNINVGSLPFYDGGYIDYHVPTQAEYNQYRSTAQDSVYVQPANNTGEVTNVYNYTNVTNDYTRPSPIYNNTYNNTYPTNYYNYPVTNEVSYPDYSSTTNNYYQYVYEYLTMPNTNTSIGTLNPSDITDNIPILSNLKNRFPFSIPFDLYEMGKALAVERAVPIIDFSFFIPVINYDAHIFFDLSPWNDLFVLFRKLELILFVVALAVFSYDHYFGT